MTNETHSHSHEPSHYIKIWAILLVLLMISICGPMFKIRTLTLITAFGIAIVKAIMVAAEFMHLRVEKKIASYILVSMLLLMSIFFFGVAPDVMQPAGENWTKASSQESPANDLTPEGDTETHSIERHS